jgi:hypothetical protein
VRGSPRSCPRVLRSSLGPDRPVCLLSLVVEHSLCKRKVGGSIPPVGCWLLLLFHATEGHTWAFPLSCTVKVERRAVVIRYECRGGDGPLLVSLLRSSTVSKQQKETARATKKVGIDDIAEI